MQWRNGTQTMHSTILNTEIGKQNIQNVIKRNETEPLT